MLKSNKLIIFLISLPFLMVIVFYSLSEHPGYSDDGNFVRKHEAAIKSEIIAHLAQEKQDIESVTLLPNTARGEYDNGGDVSGHYHIYFTAYVNHNRERTINVELFFPDASIPPFTLFPPNPYKDKGKKMSNWVMGNIEVSEETSRQYIKEITTIATEVYRFLMLLKLRKQFQETMSNILDIQQLVL